MWGGATTFGYARGPLRDGQVLRRSKLAVTQLAGTVLNLNAGQTLASVNSAGATAFNAGISTVPE